MESERNNLVKEAAVMLPFVSFLRGDLGMVGNLLGALFQCEVEVVKGRYSSVDTTRAWLPQVTYKLLIPDMTPSSLVFLSGLPIRPRRSGPSSGTTGLPSAGRNLPLSPASAAAVRTKRWQNWKSCWMWIRLRRNWSLSIRRPLRLRRMRRKSKLFAKNSEKSYIMKLRHWQQFSAIKRPQSQVRFLSCWKTRSSVAEQGEQPNSALFF